MIMKIEIVSEVNIDELAKELATNKLNLEQLLIALPSELDSFLMSVILSKISTPTNMDKVVRTVIDNLPEQPQTLNPSKENFWYELNKMYFTETL